MQRAVRIAMVVLVLLVGACGDDDDDAAPSSPVDADLVERAAEITDLVAANEWAEVRAGFDENMTSKLSEAGLADAWTSVTGLVGAFVSRGEPAASRSSGDVQAFDTPMHFERGDMKSRIAFDPDGKVAGLFILRPEVE